MLHNTRYFVDFSCFKLTNRAIRFRLREQSRVKPTRIEKIGYTTEYTSI